MIRRWLLPVVAVALAWLAFRHRAELADVAGTLAHGRAMWVACAVALQLLYYLAYAGLYRAAFRTVGSRCRGATRSTCSWARWRSTRCCRDRERRCSWTTRDGAGSRGRERRPVSAHHRRRLRRARCVLLIASATTVASRGPTPQRFLFAAALVFAVVLGATMVFAIGIAFARTGSARSWARSAPRSRGFTRAAERNPSDWPERATSGSPRPPWRSDGSRSGSPA